MNNSTSLPSTSGSGSRKRLILPENEKKKTKKQKKISDYMTSKNEKQKNVTTHDWRKAYWGFSALRNRARKRCLFTDIQFVMGEGDQRKTFHAHKVILACASPMFECMFYGPMADTRTVIETDDDPEIFEMLLDYMYGKESVKIKSLMTAWNFFMTADKYLVHNIDKKAKDCIKDIYNNDDDDDFWNVMQDRNLSLLCPRLYDNFKTYIMENTIEFTSANKWLKAPETIVETVLKMNALNITEYSLLMRVTEWAYRNKRPFTSEILKQYYKHIRFATISSYDLMQFMDRFPKTLEAETYLEILRHIHGKSGQCLPAWCSKKKTTRKAEYSNLRKPGSGWYD